MYYTYADQFYYSATRVRALEPKLLDMTEVERMLGAKSAKDAYKILNDLEYSTHVADIERVEDFQDVITAGLADSKAVLDSICPDSRILDILFLRYDFHNIKAVLKGLQAGKDLPTIKAALLPLGRVDLARLTEFFMSKGQSGLPLPFEYNVHIIGSITKAKQAYEENGNDPRLIDLILDQSMMNLMSQIAASTRNSFVIDFIKSWVDLQNIKTFLRIKLLKEEAYFEENGKALHLFAQGGHVDSNTYLANIDAKDLHTVFRWTPYNVLVANGLEAFEKFKSFVYLEKYAEEFLMNKAKASRYIIIGPEALLAYFFAKQNNAQIIRMIMVGKLNGLPEEAIRERLNQLYV
jgi:V/A-type H+-transporting ATPase subunit C